MGTTCVSSDGSDEGSDGGKVNCKVKRIELVTKYNYLYDFIRRDCEGEPKYNLYPYLLRWKDKLFGPEGEPPKMDSDMSVDSDFYIENKSGINFSLPNFSIKIDTYNDSGLNDTDFSDKITTFTMPPMPDLPG